ncbi:glucosaminidase domain-containing protein [Cupriavidus pauculus]|uniref:glucosaminidase domain-containing protein n=1 Tax=Cupriavidus pauculus TaxID=82633 RepID=UPI001C936B6E|nr:glucosaminidase domain-containing protein [Cupriavidus pauculus]MBY4730736.1 glucosaminidase domain-containing protein [Cupriavidus pauculus]
MDNVKRFAQTYGPVAAEVGQRIGVAPDVLLGQWGLETGWGKSVIPGTNNLGNIKDFSGGGTRAVDNMTGSNDAYRSYASPSAFGSDFADLISRRYRGAVGAGADANKFATALKAGGYAEDPAYVSKLAGATNLVRKFADMALTSVSGTANAATGGDLAAKVKQAKEAGYSDDEIFQHLGQSQAFAEKLKQARDAGYSDADIRQHFGLAAAPPAAAASPAQATPAAAPAPAAKDEPGIIATLGATAGKGFGNAVLGAQQLVGKGLQAVGAQTAGDWLVKDATEGARRLEQQAKPYADANPVTAVVGEVAGSVANPINRLVPLAGSAGLAGTALRAGAQGAISGAVTPVTQDDGNFAQNKLAQIATGAGIGAAIPVAGRAVTGAGRYVGNAARSLVDPFTEAGQNRIAGNILQRFAGNSPVTANTAALVPGSQPTLAQATGNAGIATLERGLQSATPQAANAFAERGAQNAAARGAALEGATGTAADIATAEAARGARASQQLAAAFQNAQPANPQGALGIIDSILNGPSGKRDSVRAVLNNIRSKLVNADGSLETNAETLYNSVRKQIGDLLDARSAASNPAGLQASRELIAVRDALDQDITAAAPGFGQYLSDYAAASRPINAMEFLQGLKLTDAQGNITLAKVQNAIANLTKQRAASGANGAKAVSQSQLDALTAIRDDLLRQSNSGVGRSVGSNTFQNLATNNILENTLPGPVRALAGGTNGPVGTLAGKVGNWIYGGANENIQNRLLQMLLDPQLGQQALQNVGGAQAAGAAGGNALLQRLAPQLIRPGIAGGNMLMRPAPAGANAQ